MGKRSHDATDIAIRWQGAPSLGRRAVLSGAMALGASAFSAGGAALGEVAKAPRRQVLTTGFNSAGPVMTPVAALSTFALTMTLEAPITAFRIALANPTPTPYQLQGIAFCEAEGWAVRPGAEWGYVTVSGDSGGAVRRRAATAQAISVPGNRPAATGATNVPQILWSDWIECRTPHNVRPQLMFHVLVPPQTVPLIHVGTPANFAATLPGFAGRLFAAQQIPGDLVTKPQVYSGPPRPSPLTPLFAVQYKSTVPGVQLVIGGNSLVAAWFTFPNLAAMELSTPALPLSTWNVAWGAQPSRTFWPLLDMAIDMAKPSIMVCPGWIANDGYNSTAYEHFLIELRESVARTRKLGGISIVLQGLAANLFELNKWQEWRSFDRALSHSVRDALVFDAAPLAEDPNRPGDWRPEFTNDKVHPNFAGNIALSVPFGRFLQTVL